MNRGAESKQRTDEAAATLARDNDLPTLRDSLNATAEGYPDPTLASALDLSWSELETALRKAVELLREKNRKAVPSWRSRNWRPTLA